MRPASDVNPRAFTLISLFGGAGGLDLGLELAGFATVAVNEIEHYACETLRANQALPLMSEAEFDRWLRIQCAQRCYGIKSRRQSHFDERVRGAMGAHQFLKGAAILEEDIRSVSSAELARAGNVSPGDLTLVAGGPPCQPFSRAGKRGAVDVEEGQLFREFVRVVNDLRPRWFLFENVKGLLLTKADVLRLRCATCGQDSVASFRERLVYLKGLLSHAACPRCHRKTGDLYVEHKRGGSLDIIIREFESADYHCTARVLNAADFGIPQLRERVIIIGSRDDEPFVWPRATHSSVMRETDQRSFFGSDTSHECWVGVGESLWPDGHPEFGPLDATRAVLWVKNVVRPHDEPVTWSLSRPSPTIGAHQGAKLAIAPEGVPLGQLRRQQWHTRGKRQSDHPPVSVKHAYLSDEELLKLQSFPEYWYLHGTRMQRAFQIGNAVPVRLGEAIGRAIIEACLNCEAPRDAQDVQALAERTA
jgi:DNA (cytosine-5)-methyltransferase 1